MLRERSPVIVYGPWVTPELSMIWTENVKLRGKMLSWGMTSLLIHRNPEKIQCGRCRALSRPVLKDKSADPMREAVVVVRSLDDQSSIADWRGDAAESCCWNGSKSEDHSRCEYEDQKKCDVDFSTRHITFALSRT